MQGNYYNPLFLLYFSVISFEHVRNSLMKTNSRGHLQIVTLGQLTMDGLKGFYIFTLLIAPPLYSDWSYDWLNSIMAMG